MYNIYCITTYIRVYEYVQNFISEYLTIIKNNYWIYYLIYEKNRFFKFNNL